MAQGEGSAARGGLLHSIKHLAAALLAAAQTRLEILATEFEEDRLRLMQLVFLGLAAAFCLGVGILLAVALIAIYFWDTHRLLAVGILILIFLAAGAVLGWILRDKVRAWPKPFATARGELAKDEAALREPRA